MHIYYIKLLISVTMRFGVMYSDILVQKIVGVEAYVIYLHVSSHGKSPGHPEKLSINK